MSEQSEHPSTRQLWAQLFQSESVDVFFTLNSDISELPCFSDYITILCQNRNEKPERVIKRTNMERSYGHRLFSGTRQPSRDTVLQFAFALELNVDETQQLLKVARATPLHPKVKRDAVIAYCLHRGKTLTEAQLLLYEHHLPQLGGAKNEI